LRNQGAAAGVIEVTSTEAVPVLDSVVDNGPAMAPTRLGPKSRLSGAIVSCGVPPGFWALIRISQVPSPLQPWQVGRGKTLLTRSTGWMAPSRSPGSTGIPWLFDATQLCCPGG
jgi:hypothetical protein